MLDITTFSPPQLPGVYLFYDKENTILYIGKAKNLKKRLFSYRIQKYGDWKIESLLENAVTVGWIVTNTENEALIKEAQLVSHHKPRFNMLLSTDSPFVYITIKNEKKRNISFFTITRVYHENLDFNAIGPFLNKRKAEQLLEYVQTQFNLFICNKDIEKGCLSYHMEKCCGTCMKNFNPQSYNKRFLIAKKLLFNQKEEFLTLLKEQIDLYSAAFEFKKAQELYYYYNNYELLHETIYNILHADYDIIEQSLLQNPLINERIQKAYNELRVRFSLPLEPITIDCFDISHFQGFSSNGSVVRFEENALYKKTSASYLLNKKNNDYLSLQETFEKHYKIHSLPTVILIDGGKGQLSSIYSVINALHPHNKTLLLSIAKKEERIFSINDLEGFVLDQHSPLGYLCIFLRDTTHNTAISLHRKEFRKSHTENEKE